MRFLRFGQQSCPSVEMTVGLNIFDGVRLGVKGAVFWYKLGNRAEIALLLCDLRTVHTDKVNGRKSRLRQIGQKRSTR
jgi:hypothetical protein